MAEEVFIAPDIPIESREQDALGRSAFAVHLANAVINLISGPGIVLGLNGPWGSGKSSIKNMILETFRDRDAPIEVVEFNPWQYESSDQLTREFFSEMAIASTARVLDTDIKQARRAKLWKYGARVAKIGAMGASAFLPVIGVAVEKTTTELIGQISKAMDETGAGLAEISDRKSLVDLKSGLVEELAKLERPILVVIDDIDRLDKDEIKLLFKLIKANADFPKVSYLLLFARDRVEAALSDTAEDGSRFLEKIVTVAFDVPPLTNKEIVRVFEQAILPVVGQDHVNRYLDESRWLQASNVCIGPYLTTMRAVKRYVSMLGFLTSVFARDGALVVDFVDLAILETLRQFEPNVYRQLPALRNYVTEFGPVFFAARNVSEDKRKQMIRTVVDFAAEAGRVQVVQSLGLLFPHVDWDTGQFRIRIPDTHSESSSNRIAFAKHFSRFFVLDIDTESSVDSSLRYVSSMTENPYRFRTLTAGLTRDHVVSLARIIADQSDPELARLYEVIFERLYVLFEPEVDAAQRKDEAQQRQIAAGVLLDILAQVASDDEIARLAVQTAEEAEALKMPIELFYLWQRRQRERRKEKDSIFRYEPPRSLQESIVKNIRLTANAALLLSRSDTLSLLSFWSREDGREEITAWLDSMVDEPTTIKAVVDRVLTPYRRADRPERERLGNFLGDWPVDLSKHQEKFEALEKEPLEADSKKTVLWVLNGIRNSTEASEVELQNTILMKEASGDGGVSPT